MLALLGVIASVRALASDPPKPTGNKAFDAGQKAGQKIIYATPVVFGGIAWILLSGFSVSTPVTNRASRGVGGGSFSKTVVVILSIIGGLVLLVVLAFVGLFILGWMRSRQRIQPPQFSTAIQRPANVNTSIPPSTNVVHLGREPERIGPYEVGTKVLASWGGRWIPGKVTKLNIGGFSLFVQLEDARYPHPLVLSTNQISLMK